MCVYPPPPPMSLQAPVSSAPSLASSSEISVQEVWIIQENLASIQKQLNQRKDDLRYSSAQCIVYDGFTFYTSMKVLYVWALVLIVVFTVMQLLIALLSLTTVCIMQGNASSSIGRRTSSAVKDQILLLLPKYRLPLRLFSGGWW